MEDTLKTSTVGLVKLQDFTQTRLALEEKAAREAARTSELQKCVPHAETSMDSDPSWRIV